MAESSNKAAEDDMYNEILDKFATSSKKSGEASGMILTKENA